MEGGSEFLLTYMGNPKQRFLVPVYQRRYSWGRAQCEQLWDDLRSVAEEARDSHFFGSVVLNGNVRGPRVELVVIDGQQRLTTVSLLLLALRDLLMAGVLRAEENPGLAAELTDYLLAPHVADGLSAVRLRLGEGDADTYQRLLGVAGGTPDPDSPLTRNLAFFKERLAQLRGSPEAFYAAVEKLEVIVITLGAQDNAQLIFESLNATGLALSEGDKVRNYLLMGLPDGEQTRLHARYWAAIEHCTGGEVSALVRDFLSVKTRQTPRQNDIYLAFKRHVGAKGFDSESLLGELARYAEWFGVLRDCGRETWGPALRDSLVRLGRLDVSVIRPFALEALRLHDEGKLTEGDLCALFAILESYLFRRAICAKPTNALNKIFLTLHADILRLDPDASRYVQTMVFVLLSKQGGGAFPRDEEFRDALAAKEVYLMNKPYRHYLFERLENAGTRETKDVYAHFDHGDYTIEHIMPQHLSPAWRAALGERCDAIHAHWLHRLANLTLTAYNASLSNAPFPAKRDAPDGGYRASGLRLNQWLGQRETWDEATLQDREKTLCDRALAIWPLPQTDFTPSERTLDACTLADPGETRTNRAIARYRWHGVDYPAKNWREMVVHLVRALHDRDSERLRRFAAAPQSGVHSFLSENAGDFRASAEIGRGLFLNLHSSTEEKCRCIKALFDRFGEDPAGLTFFLYPISGAPVKDDALSQARYDYWQTLLPRLREAVPAFKRRKTSRTNALGAPIDIDGYTLTCIANKTSAAMQIVIWMATKEQNKAAFDAIHAHKAEIETRFGVPLKWYRLEKCRLSLIEYRLDSINLFDEADRERMREFHLETSRRLLEAVHPFLVLPPAL